MLPSEMPGNISNNAAKVRIDGHRVYGDFNFASYGRTIEEIYTSHLIAYNIGTKHILNDGNLLYLQEYSGSPYSVTLSYVHRSDLQSVLSTITIEDNTNSGDYNSILHQDSDGKIWLEI